MSYRPLFISVIIFLFACNKPANDTTSAEILKQHSWYLSQSHLLSYNDDTNTLIKDTTYSSESCESNSLLRFLNGNNCNKYIACGLSTPEEKQGNWQLTSDSLLSVNILLPLSYGTGVIYKNVGIDQGKLIEVNNDYFKVKQIRRWTAGSIGNFTNYRDEVMLFYKSK
jgi:hypothetical protein